MNKQKSQSGSAHLVIIILLIITLIGALGFNFFHNETQTNAKDVQRKNDTAQLASAIANYIDGHKKLPSDLEFTDGTFISNYILGGFGDTWESPSQEEYSIKLSGEPDINTFVFIRGKNCDGVTGGDLKSSVKIMLESGDEYCQSN